MKDNIIYVDFKQKRYNNKKMKTSRKSYSHNGKYNFFTTISIRIKSFFSSIFNKKDNFKNINSKKIIK